MKNAPPLSSSEMQLKLALAMVILGFEEKIADEARSLHDLEQKISYLQQQYKELQAQRDQDTDYLERSMKQLYPALTLTVSQGGQVEIPLEIVKQLQQLQQKQSQPLLPIPTMRDSGEQEPDEKLPEVHVPSQPRTKEASSLTESSGDRREESDIDPRAKEVIEYALAHPESAVLDWKTTVQRALRLSEPPKMKGHAVFKALQRAYRLLESMHDGTVLSSSDSLKAFYTQHFVEGEQWGELKDIMNEWGITSI